jgi:hypothetical protein
MNSLKTELVATTIAAVVFGMVTGGANAFESIPSSSTTSTVGCPRPRRTTRRSPRLMRAATPKRSRSLIKL